MDARYSRIALVLESSGAACPLPYGSLGPISGSFVDQPGYGNIATADLCTPRAEWIRNNFIKIAFGYLAENVNADLYFNLSHSSSDDYFFCVSVSLSI
jgi:hypothetical protein